jgi:competence protein ComEC
MKGIFFKTILIIAVLSIFITRAFFYEQIHESDIPRQWFDTQQTITGVVVENPNTNFEKNKYSIRPYNQDLLLSSKILVTDYSGELISYGDQIIITGIIQRPEPLSTDTGRIFEYDEYLKVQDIYATMTTYQSEVVMSNQGSLIKKYLYKIRNSFLKKIITTISFPESGLLAGILLGHKTLLPKDIAKDFQIAGLSHVMVLSGYNITIIVTSITTLFAYSGCGYRLRRWCAIGSIPLFIIMTGFGASSVRAGIMAAVMLLLQITTRPQHGLRVLGITTGVMIFINPRILLHDPSFHLSMLAFIGLVYGTPLLESLIHKKNFIIETLAVQIVVFPYLIWSTGVISGVSLLVNALTVPTVPIIMLLGAGVVVVSYGVPGVALLIGVPTTWLLKYMIWIAEKAVSMKWATIQISRFSAWVMLMSYAILSVLIIYYHNYYVSINNTKNTRNVSR